MNELPSLSESYIPVGGGGLLLGFGSFVKSSNISSTIVACQPTGANTFTESFNKGFLMNSEQIDSSFGGLAVRNLDPMTFSLGKIVTDRCVQVSTLEAYKAIYDYKKITGITIEPAAAVGLAACVKSVHESTGVTVTVVTGSNSSFEIDEKIEKLAHDLNW